VFDFDARSDLTRHDDARPRHAQRTLGPSDTGRCLRQAAYAHHDTTPTEPDRAKQAARLGSLLHLGYAVVVRDLGDPFRNTEVEVVIPGLAAPGHADDVDWRHRVVLDLKTAKDRTWQRWVTYGLPDRMWDQVELYGYGLSIVAPGEWTVGIVLLNRETGEEARFERAGDPDRGRDLADVLVARQEALDASERPEEFPREGNGPGRGMPCDWCPWVSECWGTVDTDCTQLSVQAAIIADSPAAIESTGLAYLAARETESKAQEAKATARVYLQGIPAGTYGTVKITWRGGREAEMVPDPEAMEERLVDLGEHVPMMPGKTRAASINVTRAAPWSDPVQ